MKGIERRFCEAQSEIDNASSSHEAMRLHLGDVSFLGIILAHALLSFPCVPLGLAFHVQHAWSFGIDITDSCLLEKAIEFEFVIIGQSADLFSYVL